MVARVVPQSARRRHAESRKPDLWGCAAGGRWPVLSIPAAVLTSLCSSAELFQALRLDGNSFGRERQGSGPEGRPTFWEARRVQLRDKK